MEQKTPRVAYNNCWVQPVFFIYKGIELFHLLNAKVQLYYNNVEKIGTRKLASIASLKQFLHKIMQI